MKNKLEAYLAKHPEIVFEWNDEHTDAKGWLVINSLKGGAAGGGTRMRKGLTKKEVVSLAKVMEIKFSVCGPSIGGAKSGIDFDPWDPRKTEVLERWYKAIRPLLKFYYGTGGDLNVDEVKDVFPITEALGIIHPQEGVLTGHFNYSEEGKKSALNQLDHGCKLPVCLQEYSPDNGKGNYTVADMITGFGVAESVRHYYDIYKQSDLSGKSAFIQGWGNVAYAAALYLARQGVKIKVILDRQYGMISESGFSEEEIRQLFLNKDGNQLNPSGTQTSEEVNKIAWKMGCEIFSPAAASRIVSHVQLQTLIDHGTKMVSCGANVPFVEDQIIFGDTSQAVDAELALIPDFIANCGMARTFNYLMQKESLMDEHSIFNDVSSTIKIALEQVKGEESEPVNLFNRALKHYIKY